MHQVIFYPVGNGDTSQIILENGKRLLFDFRHIKKTETEDCPEINLKERLREELSKAKKKSFEVVALTHADVDHIAGSTEFFELEHAEKYRGNGRIKIDQLWVPAAMILESATIDQRGEEFVIWRNEARYRLVNGKGIRVFSKPSMLKDWLASKGIPLKDRQHLITDAGSLVPEFTLQHDGVEFFCHSPMVKHMPEGDLLRNDASLIFSVRFQAGTNTFDYLAVGDADWAVLEDIVKASKFHNNVDRLAWDIFDIPHHCSYTALSDIKGDVETIPTPLVKELLKAGKQGAYIVSPSHPIRDTAEGRAQALPPHIQAKKCYVRYLGERGGAAFLATMEEPSEANPEPIVFKIDWDGISRVRRIPKPAVILTSSPAPRAG
jgi:hypothetical protein